MKEPISDIQKLKMPVKRGYKKNTIERMIRNKVNDWLASLPDALRKAICPKIIVTGGCIPSLLLGEEPNDYDLYFADREAALLIAKHYVDQFNSNNKMKSRHGFENCTISVDDSLPDRIYIKIKSAGIAGEQEEGQEPYAYFEGDPNDENAEKFVEQNFKPAVEGADKDSKDGVKYSPIMLTDNAITLYGKVQLVIRFFGEPSKIHESYDFVHVTNYWTFEEGLVTNSEALESLLSRELVYLGSLYPICSIIRTRKFLSRGWTCSAGQYLKMIFQVSELDLTDMNVLREQLIGVDTAYFRQFIDAISKDKEKNSELKIDSAYVCKLIDRLM